MCTATFRTFCLLFLSINKLCKSFDHALLLILQMDIIFTLKPQHHNNQVIKPASSVLTQLPAALNTNVSHSGITCMDDILILLMSMYRQVQRCQDEPPGLVAEIRVTSGIVGLWTCLLVPHLMLVYYCVLFVTHFNLFNDNFTLYDMDLVHVFFVVQFLQLCGDCCQTVTVVVRQLLSNNQCCCEATIGKRLLLL